MAKAATPEECGCLFCRELLPELVTNPAALLKLLRSAGDLFPLWRRHRQPEDWPAE